MCNDVGAPCMVPLHFLQEIPMKSRKQRRTFSTDDVRKTIRHNLATHEWARKMATQHPYAELSD